MRQDRWDNHPSAAEIMRVWNRDAPNGQCWKCPDCDHWASLGGNAGHHALMTGHHAPTLQPIPPDVETTTATKTKRATLAVRAGDYMQVGYDLRLALELASVAISEAERAGAPTDTVHRLRAMLKQLRG